MKRCHMHSRKPPRNDRDQGIERKNERYPLKKKGASKHREIQRPGPCVLLTSRKMGLTSRHVSSMLFWKRTICWVACKQKQNIYPTKRKDMIDRVRLRGGAHTKTRASSSIQQRTCPLFDASLYRDKGSGHRCVPSLPGHNPSCTAHRQYGMSLTRGSLLSTTHEQQTTSHT